MEALLVISSAALAYHLTTNRRMAAVGSKDRDAPFRMNDFQPDENVQGPELKGFGHTKPRGSTVNSIHTDIVDNYRAETPVGTVNFRATGFAPQWMKQDQPPLQERREQVLEFDREENHHDTAADGMRNMALHVAQHLKSNLRTNDGVFADQERIAPPVRGGLSQNAPTLQPRHHSFALGEDLTGHVLDGNVTGGQHVSGGRSQLLRGEAHEVRPDRAIEMEGANTSAPRGLRPSGSIRGKNAALGSALPTLEWDYGATGNRAPVLAAGAQSRDRFIEPTRGMDVEADGALVGAAAGTKHRQGGNMRNQYTFGIRELLDLPTPGPAPDRAESVATARTTPASDVQQTRMQLPTVNASHRRESRFASASTGPQPTGAAVPRIQLPTVTASHRRENRFASATTGPRSTTVGPRVPDLPPPLLTYGAHPVDQYASRPLPPAQVTHLEADVDTSIVVPERAGGARPFEFRDNRNIAGTTARLQDELPVTGLLMPFDTSSRRSRPTSTIVPSEGTRREQGEFLRR